MRVIPIATLVLIAGCACEPEQVPVPMPVEVEVVRYVAIPPELLKCAADEDQPTTNGDLLLSWRSRGERLAECVRSIEAVRRLR